MKTIFVTAITALAIASTACGGSSGSSGSTGSGTVSGSAGGLSIPSVVDARSFYSPSANCGASNGSPGVSFILVGLSSKSNSCDVVNTRKVIPSETDLTLTLLQTWVSTTATPPTSNPVLAAGTYSIGNTANDANGFSTHVGATLNFVDATCSNAGAKTLAATAGTITLTSVSAAGIKGSYTLTISGSTISGNFDTVACGFTFQDFCSAVGATTTCGT